MRRKGLAQVLLTAACVLTVCMPCKAALAQEQTGAGAIDVTVRQVAPRDEPAKDEPVKDEPEDKDSDNSETDSSKKSVTPQALEDAREAASGNEWIVAPLPGNETDGATTESNAVQETSTMSLAKTGDSNLFGIAVATGCVGIGIGAIALMLRVRGKKSVARRADNESS